MPQGFARYIGGCTQRSTHRRAARPEAVGPNSSAVGGAGRDGIGHTRAVANGLAPAEFSAAIRTSCMSNEPKSSAQQSGKAETGGWVSTEAAAALCPHAPTHMSQRLENAT